MTYRQLYDTLGACFDPARERVDLPDGSASIFTYPFESTAWSILPGRERYACDVHQRTFTPRPAGPVPDAPRPGERLDIADADVVENRCFRYALFTGAPETRASGAIFLFHGLNERSWDKYLPWAHRLVAQTGKAVVLFPIAFHMNRAPAAWSDPRLMQRVAGARQAASPTIVNASFANAAISTRLQAKPQRFCWSGLQTLYDILHLVDDVRAGRHPHLAPDASIDFFGYSIGAFLCEILLMADPGARFADTRLFMFCGGVTVDRMYPNARYILDSDATIALYSFFLARFENERRSDDRLDHYMSAEHAEGLYFRAMLNYPENRELRERRIAALSDRIAALALRRDTVIPATEVLNTLQGDFRAIPVRVEVADFPYAYNHVIPFPATAPADEVERSFDHVFTAAAAHLS